MENIRKSNIKRKLRAKVHTAQSQMQDIANNNQYYRVCSIWKTKLYWLPTCNRIHNFTLHICSSSYLNRANFFSLDLHNTWKYWRIYFIFTMCACNWNIRSQIFLILSSTFYVHLSAPENCLIFSYNSQ